MFGPVVLRDGSVVPEDALTWRFSRSSGPGGQSVNTADSRVELAVDLSAITWATPADRDRVLARLAPRLALADRREVAARRDEAVEGERAEADEPVGTVLTVAASEFRSQLRNREAALARVTELLDDALRPPPPPRRATRPSRASRARRVQAESRRRSVKEMRRRPQA
ncbi:aminoacyl-tRNA hydrolase [Cellulomonas sp. WB94]|uniref:peptide chain release factor-like protein n=1 Tax=Cellulomonas sp. WB94 TaxID=2173174 RepID=UPI000D57D0EB|nr:peptide chain release factor-like protein [Cellulomonas sp. WB94]PVU82352.1 aminoacyl-tRNA hydrolase [Cellulomonas sp. WB94]